MGNFFFWKMNYWSEHHSQDINSVVLNGTSPLVIVLYLSNTGKVLTKFKKYKLNGEQGKVLQYIFILNKCNVLKDLAEACNLTKSHILPWVFFTFLKLYKQYQISHRITNVLLFIETNHIIITVSKQNCSDVPFCVIVSDQLTGHSKHSFVSGKWRNNLIVN